MKKYKHFGSFFFQSILGAFLLALSLLPNELQAQTITGTVVDESGQALTGVNIVVKEATTGTFTDSNGKFKIAAEEGNTLVFSFIGFSQQELTLGAQASVDIIMRIAESILEEVLVTGYGQTQNKRFVSTAISTLRAEKLVQDRPIQRIEQAIQGSTPAVVIIKESGSPGAPLTVKMRGVGTAGNSTPLVLVNGVQVPDMNFINPYDIQNITILKDAASSSIYGARGGNGVILLENKKRREA